MVWPQGLSDNLTLKISQAAVVRYQAACTQIKWELHPTSQIDFPSAWGQRLSCIYISSTLLCILFSPSWQACSCLHGPKTRKCTLRVQCLAWALCSDCQALNPGSQTPCPDCHPLCSLGRGWWTQSIKRSCDLGDERRGLWAHGCSFVSEIRFSCFLYVREEPQWTPSFSGKGWFMRIFSDLPAG